MTKRPARAADGRVLHGPGGRWILPLLFAASLPLVTVRIYAADELQYFAPLRSLWMDGDLDFRNEYERLLAGRPPDAPERQMLLDRSTPTGRAPAYAGIGCALLWAPFFAVGDLVARVGGWTADGYSYPYQAAVCFGSALYGLLGLHLLGSLARRTFSSGVSSASILVAWSATALPFYLYVTPPVSHATSLFAVSLFVWLWSRWGLVGGAGRSLVLGLVAGLMILVREQNGLFLVLPGFDLARTLIQGVRTAARPGIARSLAAATVLAAGVLVALLPQLVVWKILFGQFRPAAERLSFFLPWLRHLPDVLFSSNHGLIFWHPVWILGAAGMLMYRRRRPDLGTPLLAAFVLNVLFLASVSNWAGGMAFGQRRLLDCLFVVVLGSAALFERIPRSAAAILATVLVWWNLSLLVQFGSGMIPREGPVPWRTVVHNQVVTVPSRIPEMVTRYLGDRSSFFEARTGDSSS